MAIRAPHTYQGVVLPGASFFESKTNKTLGINVPLQCDDGEIVHTMWVTVNTRDRVLSVLEEALGVTEAMLADPAFIQKEFAKTIAGKLVSFTTVEEQMDDGSIAIRTQWLNPRLRPTTPEVARTAALFFNGKARPASAARPKGGAVTAGNPITDDGIPFRHRQPLVNREW